MDLIERYIYAVTRQAPIDQREDIADELRASIDDALAERGSRSKKDVSAVLTELGNPATLAQRYRGRDRSLIGPMLYPFYIRTLKFTFAIGLPIALMAGVVSQITQNPGILESAGMIIWILVSAAFHMIFWVTCVFAIFERTNVSEKDLISGDSWTPAMLPQIPADRQIPAGEAIGEIVWYGFVALLPLIAQPLIGAHIDGQTTPFFNPLIHNVWSIAVILLGLIGVIKGILKLQLRNWTPAFATFNTLYALVFCAVLIMLPVFTQIVNPAFAVLLDTHITTATLAEITQFIDWTIGISIAVIVGIYLYDAINSIRLSRA